MSVPTQYGIHLSPTVRINPRKLDYIGLSKEADLECSFLSKTAPNSVLQQNFWIYSVLDVPFFSNLSGIVSKTDLTSSSKSRK